MIVVEQPGLLTTVQDLGRPGFESQGVPRGGAADQYALRLANLLVGNDESAAGLECTLAGTLLRFTEDAVVAITGAPVQGLRMGSPFHVKRGEAVDLRKIVEGCRAYVAVAGGIDVPMVMGSRATYLAAKLGGVEGRALIRGDELKVGASSVKVVASRGWGVRLADIGKILRVVRGPQWEWFSDKMRKRFLESAYRVSKDSNRMGLRLEGEPIEISEKKELVSEAVALGTVQVPANGQPIILMADRPTLGGYPKIAAVIGVDIGKAAQLRPGDEVRFAGVSLQEAERLWRERDAEWERIRMGIRMRREGR